MSFDAMVLVLTSLEDVTSDMVITALNERGVEVARVDPADVGTVLRFGAEIDADTRWCGQLRTATRVVELQAVTAVYYRRPSPWRFDGLGQQAADFTAAEARHGLGGVLANLPNACYINHPAAITRADFKSAQLQAAARLGMRIPPTIITNDVEEARRFSVEHDPVVYKTFRGVPESDDGHAGAVWTQRIDPATLDDSVRVTAHLFQSEIPKVADVRVTVIGKHLFAHRITTPDEVLDWRSNDWDALRYERIPLPTRVAVAVQAYLETFGLVFGCFDSR